MFPIDIMPAGVQAALKWMPFYYELFCPVAIFQERLKAQNLASTRDPNRLAFSDMVHRARDVAPRLAALSSGRRLNYFLADSRETTRHPWFARFQAIVALPSSSNPHSTETRRSSPFPFFELSSDGFGSSNFFLLGEAT